MLLRVHNGYGRASANGQYSRVPRNLAAFLESSEPVAVTRHGEIVGYYVPTRRSKEASDLAALRLVWAKLDALLAASGVSEEELVEDFKQVRRRARPST